MTDTTYVSEFAYLLRDADGSVRVEGDRHVCGLFAREDWLRLLAEVGFHARAFAFEHSQVEPASQELFVAVKPS